jgi:hypothetical protein
LAGEITDSSQIEKSYVAGPVAITSAHADNVVFAGGIAGVGYAGGSAVDVRYSAALNSSVTVETANSGDTAVYAYRILGGVSSPSDSYDSNWNPILEILEADNDLVSLIGNYALEDLQPQKKIIGSEGWTEIDQGQGNNDTEKFWGNTNMDLTQDFFETTTTLGWDFTEIWEWNTGLNRPVLKSN